MSDALPELPKSPQHQGGYFTSVQMREYARLAALAEREQAAAKADSWSVPSNVKLAAGEMTAQELRTAQAVARGIAAAIRADSRSQPER